MFRRVFAKKSIFRSISYLGGHKQEIFWRQFRILLKIRDTMNINLLYNRAVDLYGHNNFEESDRICRNILKEDSLHFGCLHLLSSICFLTGRFDDALCYATSALQLQPDNTAVLLGAAQLLALRGRETEALEIYARILTLQPDHHEAFNGRGILLGHLRRPIDALADFTRAIAIKPDFADPHFNTGRISEQFGEFELALRSYRAAVRLNPTRGSFFNALAECGYRAVDAAQMHAVEAVLTPSRRPGIEDRIGLHFGLAKAYEDHEHYDRSFEHLAAGNALKRKTLHYDEASELSLFERTAAAFDMETMGRRVGPVASSPDGPIFIVGMPRSGSSLVEAILASHSRVFAAGEVGFLEKAINEFGALGSLAKDPERLSALSELELREIGERYLGIMRDASPRGKRPVDKLPINFRHIGLIHKALPDARIIHTCRDPLDTCLSCFFRLFANANQPFSYDLAELGRYYRGYERLMAHWRSVLPGQIIVDLRYEDLVSDLPGEVRRLLAHCGLAWEPNCLEFHKTHRQVRTDSRVHKPIYRTSIGRWRNYEAFLAPLQQ
ncbi:tetratricopeptide repeat-containing sulfotransferase family protein [Labrys okinawensis]|uniref:tetratricopeptide repeat-containing sulfotransferase family protein n=1 Tax=Labrys okinawensis TaxID=346911 RepID=UPI0039BCF53E